MTPVRISTVLGTMIMLSAATGTVCADPAARGLEIAREAERCDQGFGDSKAHIKMVLKNRHGQESTREMRTRSMEVENDGDKLFIIFDTPRDVYGTAFLSFTHVNQPDDQWLYLPALKRVKRISSNNKSGPFVGSEFAYEDLVSQEVGKYTYKYLRDETLGGEECYVVERYPTYEHSGYTKQIVWFDQAEYRPQQVEYYDRKDELLKTLTFRDYRQYRDKFWRAQEMFMQNHQTQKSTLLVWSDYAFQNGYTERDFDTNSLKRAR